MATPVGGIQITIRKQSDNSLVAQQVTNTIGQFNVNLAPGTYKMEIGTLAGYSLSGTVVTEDGVVEASVATTTVTNIVITENGTTSAVINFIANT